VSFHTVELSTVGAAGFSRANAKVTTVTNTTAPAAYTIRRILFDLPTEAGRAMSRAILPCKLSERIRFPASRMCTPHAANAGALTTSKIKVYGSRQGHFPRFLARWWDSLSQYRTATQSKSARQLSLSIAYRSLIPTGNDF
jgi:hypothetical protein